MKTDRYHDSYGNRMKLDTRNLVWVAEHKAKQIAERKRQEERRSVWTIVRFLVSIPCGAFAIAHADVFYKETWTVLMALGVIACLAFVASSIHDLWQGGK